MKLIYLYYKLILNFTKPLMTHPATVRTFTSCAGWYTSLLLLIEIIDELIVGGRGIFEGIVILEIFENFIQFSRWYTCKAKQCE